MTVHTLPLGELQANCHLLSGPERSGCLVIDPGGDPGLLMSCLEDRGLLPQAVLLTHGHFDHVGAISALLARWPGCPVYVHPADCPGPDPMLFPLREQLKTLSRSPDLRPLAGGERLELAGLTLEVLATPGHSPGSVTFRADNTLFTGDTLFQGSMGRTDFPGGDDTQMAASLRLLAGLEGSPAVYPGHGPATTLAAERAHNPYLREAMA